LAWKPTLTGGLLARGRRLPRLGVDASSVVGTLRSDVVGDGSDVAWRNGFGPVADLPDVAVSRRKRRVQCARRRALEPMRDLGDRDARRMAQQDVHVIGGDACREQRAVEPPRFRARRSASMPSKRASSQGVRRRVAQTIWTTSMVAECACHGSPVTTGAMSIHRRGERTSCVARMEIFRARRPLSSHARVIARPRSHPGADAASGRHPIRDARGLARARSPSAPALADGAKRWTSPHSSGRRRPSRASRGALCRACGCC
jgi:hypothetical protein